MYKIKYILNILRDILYLTMTFYFTYIKIKVSYVCIVLYWEYTYFSSALKSKWYEKGWPWGVPWSHDWVPVSDRVHHWRFDVMETFWMCHDFLFDSAFSYANRVNVGRSLWYLIHPSISAVTPLLVVRHDLCLIFVFVCLSIQIMYRSVVGSSKTSLEIKLGFFLFSSLPSFFPSSQLPPLLRLFYSVFMLCKMFCRP